MKPMLAKTLGPKFDKWPVFIQPKLNGIRACYEQIRGSRMGVFQSRDEKMWNSQMLLHLREELLSVVLPDNLILDGELYVHSWRLQRINSAVAVNRKHPTSDTPLIQFHVFDVVDLSLPFSERFLPVYNLLNEANLPHIVPVRTELVHSREEMEGLFRFWTSLGYEGVMLRPDGSYVLGETAHGTEKRSEWLWKYKQWQDGEFLCIAATTGEGKASIGFGALVLLKKINNAFSWNPVTETGSGNTFKVGTGFTDEERTQPPPIGKMVKIRYLELTREGIPFNPSFLCIM